MPEYVIVAVPEKGQFRFPSSMSKDEIADVLQKRFGASKSTPPSPSKSPLQNAVEDVAVASVPFNVPLPPGLQPKKQKPQGPRESLFPEAMHPMFSEPDPLHPQMDPVPGAIRAGAGVEQIIKGKGDFRENVVDVIHGGGEMLLPAAPILAAVAPIPMAVGVGAGFLLEEGTKQVLRKFGVSDETSDMWGAILSMAPITGMGAKRLINIKTANRLNARLSKFVKEAKAAPTEMMRVQKQAAIKSLGDEITKLEATWLPAPPSGKAASESAKTLYSVPQPKSAIESAKVLEGAPMTVSSPTHPRPPAPIEPMGAPPLHPFRGIERAESNLGATAGALPDRLYGLTPDQVRMREQLGLYSHILPTKIAEKGMQATPLGAKRGQSQKGSFTVTREDAQAMANWVGEKGDNLRGYGLKARTELVDRYDPIAQLVKGKSLSPAQDPYIAARMYAGHMGKVDNRLDGLRGILRPAKEKGLLEATVEWAKYERYNELATPVRSVTMLDTPDVQIGGTFTRKIRGQEYPVEILGRHRFGGWKAKNLATGNEVRIKNANELIGDKEVRRITKFPGGKNIEQLRAEQSKLEAIFTPEEFAEVRNITGQLRDYSRGLLDDAYDAQLISTEAYESIIANNQKYIPLQRLEMLAAEIEKAPNKYANGSNAFNVASQNIIHRIHGSTKDVADPLQAIIRNTNATVALAERNRVALKMADLANDPQFKGVVFKPKNPDALPQGMDTFSVLRDGKVEKYAVPKEVAEAMKGMSQGQVGVATQIARASSSVLRAGATSLNAAFFLPNMVRDTLTAKLLSKVGYSPIREWPGAALSVLTKDARFKQWMEEGGGLSGYLSESRAHRSVPQTLSRLTESKTRSAARMIYNPVHLLRTVGEISESSTRVGVFGRGLKKGLTPLESAFNSRNASIDFARSGNFMRLANMWVPFLNARAQGMYGTLSAIKNRPGHSMKVAAYTVALPTMLTYMSNRTQFSDVWDNIDQWEKDSSFMLIYGDEKDENDRYTQVLKMPKGDIGRIFGNVLENTLEAFWGSDPKGAREVFMQAASDISFIGFADQGNLSVGTMVAATSPVFPKAVGELITNTDVYRDQPIVNRKLEPLSPELQYEEGKTSPIAMGAAKALTPITKAFTGSGVSPTKLQYFIESQTGGVGRNIMRMEHPGKSIARRFSGASGRGQQDKQFSRAKEIEQGHIDENALIRRDAEEAWESSKSLPVAEKQAMATELKKTERGRKVYARIARIRDEENAGLNSFERHLRYIPGGITARAEVIHSELMRLPLELLEKKNGKTVLTHPRRDKYTEWKEKKLITEGVIDQLKKYPPLNPRPKPAMVSPPPPG